MKRLKFNKAQMAKIIGNVKLKNPIEMAIANTIKDQQEWLTSELKRISPANVFADAMSGEPERVAASKKYYAEENIRVEQADHGLTMAIFEGNKMISEFKFVSLEDPKK